MTLTLPRNAFSVRDAARAGDVWRTFQDAAVIGSARRGWHPARYQAENCAFVVRRMTVVHHRETHFGESIGGKTWVERFRRGVFSTRQIRLTSAGEPVADALQEWVHVTTHDGIQVARASADLLSSFEEHPTDESVELPSFEAVPGAVHTFDFQVWFTWMDPLDHANHPAYVDWCDEAVCQVMHRAGLRPVDLVPVAEQVTFKTAVLGGDAVRVEIALAGRTAAGDAVVKCKIHRVDMGELAAEAILVRTTASGADALAVALGV